MLSLGGTTNIAGAFYHYPEAKSSLKELVIMGGNYHGLELNFLVDKAAADFVLELDVNKVLITAQLCLTTTVDSTDANKLKESSCGAFGKRIYPVVEFKAWSMGILSPWLFDESQNEKRGFHPWDVIGMDSTINAFKTIF